MQVSRCHLPAPGFHIIRRGAKLDQTCRVHTCRAREVITAVPECPLAFSSGTVQHSKMRRRYVHNHQTDISLHVYNHVSSCHSIRTYSKTNAAHASQQIKAYRTSVSGDELYI
jgi:hypothetical protein